MRTIVRVNKGGTVFLLCSTTLKDPQAILCAVDHADVHYTLGTERAERDRKDHGIVPSDDQRFTFTINL